MSQKDTEKVSKALKSHTNQSSLHRPQTSATSTTTLLSEDSIVAYSKWMEQRSCVITAKTLQPITKSLHLTLIANLILYGSQKLALFTENSSSETFTINL